VVVDTLSAPCYLVRDAFYDTLFIPEIETADGEFLDGEEYKNLSLGEDDVDLIYPPSKLAPGAADLPEQFLQRIRGGIQLQYVNSIYREGHDPTTSDACFVLQEIYNILLREGGHTRQEIIDKGWEKATTRYRRIKSADERKPAILDKARSLVNRLRDEHIITERNSELHARKAQHPQQDLTF
jgi:hypothetical protein